MTPALQQNFAIPASSFCTHPLAEFPLETDCDPIYLRQHPIPIKSKEAFIRTINEWKATKRIERAPQSCPWNTPVHCVLKKDEQGRYDENNIDVRPCFNFNNCTTFTNPFDGTRWRFVANTFGPKNTPMHFQNLMETILDGLEGVLVYLDDIIVVSSVIKDHAKQVNDVLNTLTRWNLRVSKSKIHLCYRRLKVLGHILTP